MIFTNSTNKDRRILFLIMAIISCGYIFNLASGHQAQGAPVYQINGFYLGATPAELGVILEIDPLEDKKYYEVEKSGARLFFIRIQETFRAYRIIKEEKITGGDIRSNLENLKLKYGAPNKQQIKTSSTRRKYQMKYTTTVKNISVWKISESQDYIAEIESNRIVYELLDHDPEKIKTSNKLGTSDGDDFIIDNWDPDY